jgi:hypothetical protein
VDRIALFGVLVSLLFGLVDERFTLLSFALTFCCLAWLGGQIVSGDIAGRGKWNSPD